MIARVLSASAGLLAVLVFSASAYAVDQLPLPNHQPDAGTAEIREFASADMTMSNSHICADVLKKYDDRVDGIKAYRQCRADHTLSQMAVWRWQDKRLN